MGSISEQQWKRFKARAERRGYDTPEDDSPLDGKAWRGLWMLHWAARDAGIHENSPMRQRAPREACNG